MTDGTAVKAPGSGRRFHPLNDVAFCENGATAAAAGGLELRHRSAYRTHSQECRAWPSWRPFCRVVGTGKIRSPDDDGRAISPVDGHGCGGLLTLCTADLSVDTGVMSTAGVDMTVRLSSAVVTAAIAVSAYAGVVGLVGGGISFGDAIDARLPFGSVVLAGLALLVIVALPMTVASVAAGRGSRHGADLVFGAGLLLVAWIGVELAFIQVYSWFHPTYLVAAIVVLGLGWLMNRTASEVHPMPPQPRQSPAQGRPVIRRIPSWQGR